MDWDDIRVFLAVARAGTLGGAARVTGQTQPTMGRRLRTFEEAVGQVLFQRTNDGFVLTDEGAAMLNHAERIEAEVLGLERQIAGSEAELEGTIRVSSSDWFGEHMLTPVFAAFLKAHPKVTIDLVTEARLLNLARREADLVFRIRPFEEPDIAQRKLMQMPYALYTAQGAEMPEAGDGEGFGLVTMDDAFRHLPDVIWLRRMLPRAHVAYGSNNRGAQARMCAAGAGLAVLPTPLGDHTPGLVRVDLGEAPPGRDVWVGYHRDMRRLARLRALLELAIEMIGTP